MDLLFQKYASPFDLMNTYINNGRFGEFVTEFIKIERKRKREQLEKEENNKLWEAYIHSFSDESFDDWKAKAVVKVTKPSGRSGTAVTREEILSNKKIIRLLDSLDKE